MNVLLKFDKHYSYIMMDVEEEDDDDVVISGL
jgi:hypothetical protein